MPYSSATLKSVVIVERLFHSTDNDPILCCWTAIRSISATLLLSFIYTMMNILQLNFRRRRWWWCALTPSLIILVLQLGNGHRCVRINRASSHLASGPSPPRAFALRTSLLMIALIECAVCAVLLWARMMRNGDSQRRRNDHRSFFRIIRRRMPPNNIIAYITSLWLLQKGIWRTFWYGVSSIETIFHEWCGMDDW